MGKTIEDDILIKWINSYDKKRNCYGELVRHWSNQHEIDTINLANAIRELNLKKVSCNESTRIRI